MKRFFPVLVAVLIAALLASACGSSGQAAAATVNSDDILRKTLNEDLEALAGNPELVKQAKAQGVNLNPTDGSINIEVAAQWLSSLLSQAVIDQEFDERDLTITAADRRNAQQSIASNLGGPDVFAEFPKAFQTRVIDRQARLVALRRDIDASGAGASEAKLRAYFDANKETLCPSDKLVSHILVKTEAEAKSIETQLQDGADFAELAKKLSTDTGSGANGGLLDCLGATPFVEPFQGVANGLGVGEVSAPVQTEFGWHVIKVDPFTFDEGHSIVEEAYLRKNGDPLSTLITRGLRKAKIWVDPRYGKLRRTATGVGIVPPKAPNPRNNPETTSTSVPAPAQTGGSTTPTP